ncbi:MAG TPA: GTPase domain-containing protein [Tepidisphaeraceae bacterium]|jgi:hypothetical protein|nr:GTPase domain-containing protein [Tepidisphaeraceae bacterium]
MSASTSQIRSHLRRLDAALSSLPATAAHEAVRRHRTDAAALAFHLDRGRGATPLVAILGGTGTGKSTLVNRLLDQTLTAASFRRTHTAGCVAVARKREDVPPGWLGVEHVTDVPLPARGTPDQLAIVAGAPTDVVLIDTPDLDGDHPAHHAQADRAFRWATAVVFVVTPEKYQMTELLPYYRLASRYQLPAAFVMNKCEERVVLDDYRALLASRDWPEASVFVVPRDDAAIEPPPGAALADLQHWLAKVNEQAEARDGAAARLHDLVGRLRDHVIAPLRAERRAVDDVINRLRAMETPPAGVDVNPITQQLQRRLQQRSVLYLIGPQRVLDRARQIPSLLARLPRAAWDYVARGEVSSGGAPSYADEAKNVPDFRQLLMDAFAVVRSRVDDAVRSSDALAPLTADPTYTDAFLPADRAAAIADDELAALKEWLEARWNADPRDTRLLRKLMSVLPGADRLSKFSEAAPYLLTIVVATHHAFFGPIDLIILGGYSLAAWMTERLSNEVTARTRATNVAISDRFTKLAHDQIASVTAWLDSRSADKRALESIENAANEMEEMV